MEKTGGELRLRQVAEQCDPPEAKRPLQSLQLWVLGMHI